MTRSKRAALTFVSNGFLTLITLLTGFVAARLLVRWLGVTRLGLYMAANGWMGQLGLLEIGVAGAMMPVLARAIARKNEEEIRDGLAASVRVYRLVTAGCLVGAAILVIVIPRLMDIPTGSLGDVRIGLLIGALGICLMPLAPLRAMIDASQRGYLLNGVLVVQSLLITGLSLLFAYLRWGVEGQFLAALLGNILFFAAMLYDTRRLLPNPPLFAPASPQAQAQISKLNRPTLICGVCGKLGVYTDNLLIAYFFGPTMLPAFAFTQRLATVVQTQLLGVGGATWAALAELHVSGERELFERRLVQLTRLVVTLGIAANIPIIAFNGTFFRLWQPSLHFGGEALTLCASLNSIFMAIMSLWGWVYTGTGRIDRLVPLTVIAAAVNLVISIAMTRAGFVFGPVFGTTIGIGVIGFLWYPLEMRRTFGLSPANLYRAVVVPFIPGVIYGSVVVWFGHRFLSAGWIGLAVLTAMAGGGYLVLAACTVLGAGERRMLRARIVSRIYTKPATETVSPRG